MTKFNKKLILAFIALVYSVPSLANTSPWLPIPKTLEFSITRVSQESTKFHRGTELRDLPFGSFNQDTTWIGVKYGLSDKLALDFRGGASSLDAGALGESDDLNDMSFGVTRSILDEIEHGMVSVSFRIGAILAGSYDVGQPNSIGDGEDAIEATVALGKAVTDHIAFAVDAGLKFASGDVPTETLLNAGLHFQANDRFGIYGQFQTKKSNGDLDIGGTGFTPAGFPETAEEYSRFRLGAGVSIMPELRLDLSIYDTRSGRNTADFDAVSLTFAYTLDLFKP